jgi:hypothetical protein
MNAKTLTRRKTRQLISLAEALGNTSEYTTDKQLKDVIAQTLNGHDSRTLKNWLHYLEAIQWIQKPIRHGSNGILGHDKSVNYTINHSIIEQNLKLISITEKPSENPKDSGEKLHHAILDDATFKPEPTEAKDSQTDSKKRNETDALNRKGFETLKESQLKNLQLVEAETRKLPSLDNTRKTSSENTLNTLS